MEETWENAEFPQDVNWSLSDLTDAGNIEPHIEHGRIDFAHDQIQAFKLIPDDQKQRLQLLVGCRPIEGLDSLHSYQFLFPVVELCIAEMDLLDEQRKKPCSFWAFLAGDAALRERAYETAFLFLDAGIVSLGDKPFEVNWLFQCFMAR